MFCLAAAVTAITECFRAQQHFRRLASRQQRGGISGAAIYVPTSSRCETPSAGSSKRRREIMRKRGLWLKKHARNAWLPAGCKYHAATYAACILWPVPAAAAQRLKHCRPYSGLRLARLAACGGCRRGG